MRGQRWVSGDTARVELARRAVLGLNCVAPKDTKPSDPMRREGMTGLTSMNS